MCEEMCCGNDATLFSFLRVVHTSTIEQIGNHVYEGSFFHMTTRIPGLLGEHVYIQAPMYTRECANVSVSTTLFRILSIIMYHQFCIRNHMRKCIQHTHKHPRQCMPLALNFPFFLVFQNRYFKIGISKLVFQNTNTLVYV
jgi:hypothetical protein